MFKAVVLISLLFFPFMGYSRQQTSLQLSEEEIKKILLAANSTQDKDLMARLEILLNPPKKPLITTRNIVKVTAATLVCIGTLILAAELLSILLGDELLLKRTKQLYDSACKLRAETKEVGDGVKELSDETSSLKEKVQSGVDKTDAIAEEVHILAESLDFKENLARNDVELFRRIEVLEARLAAQNGDAFVSLSEALNITPPTPSTPVSPGIFSRRHSVFK